MSTLSGTVHDALAADTRSVRRTRQLADEESLRMTAAPARTAWLWLVLYGIVIVGSVVVNFKQPPSTSVGAASVLKP